MPSLIASLASRDCHFSPRDSGSCWLYSICSQCPLCPLCSTTVSNTLQTVPTVAGRTSRNQFVTLKLIEEWAGKQAFCSPSPNLCFRERLLAVLAKSTAVLWGRGLGWTCFPELRVGGVGYHGCHVCWRGKGAEVFVLKLNRNHSIWLPITLQLQVPPWVKGKKRQSSWVEVGLFVVFRIRVSDACSVLGINLSSLYALSWL